MSGALMLPNLESDIRSWLAGGLRFNVEAFDDLTHVARAVLYDFWDFYPDYRATDNGAALQQLEAIAKVAGFENADRLFGTAVVHGNGDMSLEIEPNV